MNTLIIILLLVALIPLFLTLFERKLTEWHDQEVAKYKFVRKNK